MSERRDLSWRAAQTPDAPALETDSVTWSFADLADFAGRGAAYLRAMAPPGDVPIGLLLWGSQIEHPRRPALSAGKAGTVWTKFKNWYRGEF